MTDRLDVLRTQLHAKMTQIELLVAQEESLGNVEEMQPFEYEALQRHVEQLIAAWEQNSDEGAFSENFRALAAERQAIWEQIQAEKES
jgi:hypothetical protein